MKKRDGKKGLSLMISYVLLISFAVVMSAVVYMWISKYAPTKALDCPDGVSIFISDVDCNMTSSNLTLRIKNNGRFSFDGYFIHATNSTSQELATIDLSRNLIAGGNNITKSVLFGSAIDSDNEKTSVFRLDSKIYSIEIIPVRYQKVDNRMRFVQCGNARIRESVDCV